VLAHCCVERTFMLLYLPPGPGGTAMSG